MKRGKTPTPGQPRASAGDSAADAAAFEAARDELYGAPFDQFVPLRRDLALRLRAGGNAAGARAMAAAPKPTRTAWAWNQVARRSPEVIAAVVDAWSAAAAGPLRREGADLLEGARRYRETVADAIRGARAVLAEEGVSLSTAQVRRMTETLQALVSDEKARAELLRGSLTRDLEVVDPFAGLEADSGATVTDDVDDGDAARAQRDEKDRERTESERAQRQEKDRERTEREQRERERAERERAERERADLRAKIQGVETSVAEARRRAEEAEGIAVRAQEEARRTRAMAEQMEIELALLQRQLQKVISQ